MIATISGRQDGGIKVYRKHIVRNCTKCSKKNELKPWKVKGWVIPPEQNSGFVANMEQVLDVHKDATMLSFRLFAWMSHPSN